MKTVKTDVNLLRSGSPSEFTPRLDFAKNPRPTSLYTSDGMLNVKVHDGKISKRLNEILLGSTAAVYQRPFSRAANSLCLCYREQWCNKNFQEPLWGQNTSLLWFRYSEEPQKNCCEGSLCWCGTDRYALDRWSCCSASSSQFVYLFVYLLAVGRQWKLYTTIIRCRVVVY